MRIKYVLRIGILVSAIVGGLAFYAAFKLLSGSIPNTPDTPTAPTALALSAWTDRQILYSVCLGCAAFLVSGLAYVQWASRKITTGCQTIATSLHNLGNGDFSASDTTSGLAEFRKLEEPLGTTVQTLKHRIGFAEGVLNAIADAYPFMTCDQDAKIDFIGKQLLKVSGKTGDPSEYIGMTIGGYIYGEPDRKTRTDKVVHDGIRVEGETRIEGNGKTNILQFSADPIYGLDNEQIGALTIYFDLTEVKEQQKEIEENASRVAQIAAELVDITEQVNASAGIIASQIKEAAQGALHQSERTTETATAMEQMNSTTLEVARNAISAADNAVNAKEVASAGQSEGQSLIRSIEAMRSQTETLGGFMEELGKQTDSVGSVINVIQDIADQTNLLALNAAIEAARAGDAGRGFAVVADEVRKLAEKTMNATDEVSTAIESIQHGASRSIEAMKQANKAVETSTGLAMNSGKTLEKIVDIVNSTSDQVQSIATAAEEQSASSDEINSAVEDITTIASQTAEGMQQANEASTDLVKMCGELNTLIRRLSA
ncbi:MAG: methyl-accepting chemotaxis protein [Desulfovibrio sp.]|uniref:methyl-accepting chemotaxis protein n=1 Tax=Desulfovibrio sp. 7SRBS1 TaxID=3378064 RepID=UPI003B3E9BFC